MEKARQQKGIIPSPILEGKREEPLKLSSGKTKGAQTSMSMSSIVTPEKKRKEKLNLGAYELKHEDTTKEKKY